MFYFPSCFSGITVLDEPESLPKLTSTVVGPVTRVSSSSRPSSLDLPQLTQGTSIFNFLQEIKYLQRNIEDKRGKK